MQIEILQVKGGVITAVSRWKMDMILEAHWCREAQNNLNSIDVGTKALYAGVLVCFKDID